MSRVSPVVGSVTWPKTVANRYHKRVYWVLLNAPASVRQVGFDAVEEVFTENVFFSFCQILFVFLHIRAQVHVVVEVGQLFYTAASECIILLDFLVCIFHVGPARNDLTSAFDTVDSVAKSVKFSQSICWHLLHVDATDVQMTKC